MSTVLDEMHNIAAEIVAKQPGADYHECLMWDEELDKRIHEVTQIIIGDTTEDEFVDQYNVCYTLIARVAHGLSKETKYR